MRLLLHIFVFLFSLTVFGQSGFIKHKVKKGETVYRISKKYDVEVNDIYKYNPSAKQSIQVGEILRIPKKGTSQKQFTKSYKVRKGETLYAIANSNGITVNEIYAVNPGLKKEGLQAGAVILIPTSSKTEPVVKSSPKKEKTKPEKNSKKSRKKANNLVSESKKYLGTPYRTGGTTKRGMDCSGLTCTVFKTENISLPRTSISQASTGRKVSVKKAQKGDLIFFRTGRKRKINHVGMIVEVKKGEVKFIHASTSRGVMISSLNEDYWKKRFVKINRVL